MATGLNLNMYKTLPGYKGILKVVLKSQIQMLVEQLAEQTGEESIVLSASVEDGTLTHLGSASGNVFITGHDDFKKQFLGFCIQRHTPNYVRQSQSSPYSSDGSLKITGKTSESKASNSAKKKAKSHPEPSIGNSPLSMEPEQSSSCDSADLNSKSNERMETEGIQMSDTATVPSDCFFTEDLVNGDLKTKKKSLDNVLKNKPLNVAFKWNRNKSCQKKPSSSKRKQTFPMQVKKPASDIHDSASSDVSFQEESAMPVSLFHIANNDEDDQTKDKELQDGTETTRLGFRRTESEESEDVVEIKIERDDDDETAMIDNIIGNSNMIPDTIKGNMVNLSGYGPKVYKMDYSEFSPSTSPYNGGKRVLKGEAKEGVLVSRGEGRYEKLITCEICGKVCRTSNMARHKKRYCIRVPGMSLSLSGDEANMKTFADL